jgi:hypothetical protein
MKKLLFTALIAFVMNACLHGKQAKAQITLAQTYDSASTTDPISGYNQLMMINFAVSGERYVRINRSGASINIYDLNQSLLKTISLASLPMNLGTSEFGIVLYLSQNLFSTDSKITFMYIRNPCGSASPYYITDIVNEDGAILFSDTGAAEVNINMLEQQYPIYNTSHGTVMILSYRSGQAKVFNLPGTLTSCCNEDNIRLLAAQRQSGISNAYPNPNNGSTKIDYTLPDGVNEGEIVFYNLMGNEVKRFKVDRTFNTLLISTKDIAAGTYYYQLQTAGESSGGKKMVVVK